MKRYINSVISFILIISIAFSFSFSAFANTTEQLAEEISESQKEYNEYLLSRKDVFSMSTYVSNGLLYTENDFEVKGNAQKSFIFKLDTNTQTVPAVSFGKYLFGADRLSTMVSEQESEGKRVVGAVNGDFYSTTTGVPLSVMIKDFRLISSDDEKYFVSFDNENKVSIMKNRINISFVGERAEIKVDHFNKYPTLYALYLLDDSFSNVTKSKVQGLEYVFMPYVKDETELEETENTKEIQNEQSEAITEETPQAITEETTEETIEETIEETTEEILPVVDVLENGVDIDGAFYEKLDTFARTDCEIDVVLYEIRQSSVDAPIPQGCFVLVSDNAQAHRTDTLCVGDTYTLKISSGGVLENTANAIGCGGLIVKNGEYFVENEESHYKTRNPRTALGICEDGSMVVYSVDGRQNGYSLGLTAKELAYEMISQGCITAINLDGGGSTTVYAANPGMENASLMNLPSDISERKVANALLFVNVTEKKEEISKLFLYPQSPIVMAGGGVFSFDSILATDENYHPVLLPETYPLNFNVKFSETGTVENGVFVSSEFSGVVPIISKLEEETGAREFDAANIITVEEDFVSDCELSTYYAELAPFETLNISVFSSLKNEKVHMGTGNLLWYIEKDYMPYDIYTEKIDELFENVYEYTAEEFVQKSKKLFYTHTNVKEEKLASPTLAAPISSDSVTVDAFGNITPKVDGETLYILAYFNDNVKQLVLDVAKYPFDDSKNHWARKELYKAYEAGIMNGESYGDAQYFFPERNMTYAEFLTVLSRILSVEGSEDFQSAFTDIADVPEWAKEHILALEENGYLNVLLENANTLTPKEEISRLDVMRILGSLCPNTNTDAVSNFADASSVQERDLQYVNNAVFAGLISGFEDGTLRPQATLTRAQSATVLIRFLSLLKPQQ